MEQHLQPGWQLAGDSALPASTPSRRLFFFNEALPEGARNLHHVYAPVTKLGTVLEGAASWEDRGVASFCSTLLRLDEGRYRLYYTAVSQHEMRIAVAESADGLHWERLNLGQERRDGQDANLIVLSGVPGSDPSLGPGRQDQVGQPQVLRTPDGRWRMYYWHHQHGWGRPPYVYTVAESSDGLRWHVPAFSHPALNSHWLGDQSALKTEERLAEKARRTNDANYVYYNPRLGCYEQFSQWFVDAIAERRVAEDNCPDFHRMIQRRVSADGLSWSAPELVIQADGRDPWDQQFYHLAVQYHEDWMIGSLGHYRVENAQQTQDLELAFSRDGRHWERPLRGGFIPREPGGRDAEGIYPPNAWIDLGDRWLCLYTGTARKHNQHADDSQPGSCIIGATWSKNRLVGLQAQVPGGFLTPVFFLQSAEIRVDAAVRGWLRAEMCDPWGRKLDGYHLEDCIANHGDDTAHTLRWRGKSTADLRHDALRLRFEFADAEMYNVQF
ncbi:MAG: glycoside hydrolase family protein [Anaerolineae bacterium]